MSKTKKNQPTDDQKMGVEIITLLFLDGFEFTVEPQEANQTGRHRILVGAGGAFDTEILVGPGDCRVAREGKNGTFFPSSAKQVLNGVRLLHDKGDGCVCGKKAGRRKPLFIQMVEPQANTVRAYRKKLKSCRKKAEKMEPIKELTPAQIREFAKTMGLSVSDAREWLNP